MATTYLEEVLRRLKKCRKSKSGWTARCPAHDDRNNSLSIAVGRDGRVLMKCFAGCDFDRIVESLGLEPRNFFPPDSKPIGRSRRSKRRLTMEDLARHKLFPADFLRGLGVEDCERGVRINYLLEDGSRAPRQRIRSALKAGDGSYWERGQGSPVPYGLWRLTDARKAGSLNVVEGESDCWTLWLHEFPALGLPGASMASNLELSQIVGIERLFVFCEPDHGGATFVAGVARRLCEISWQGQAYVVTLPDVKDPSELHMRDTESFKVSFQAALDSAQPLPLQQENAASFVESGFRDTPYRATECGLVWLKQTANGEQPVRLTNFTARIVAEVVEDDGAEVRRALEIEAAVNGQSQRFSVSASQFSAMNWPLEHLGPGAIVFPGFGTKDHARAAIQLLSGECKRRVVFTHLGWRKIDGTWMYLHAGGAIGSSGALEGVEVSLAEPLSKFTLPAPPTGNALAQAIRACLKILDLAPLRVTAPLIAAVPRSVLGTADFSIHTDGPTGAGKTELVTLAQQFFGSRIDARNLPGSWTSTGNALEGLAFLAKDAILVVDDFAPAGSTYDVQRYHREADRVLRAQGNNSGRQRMRSDATLRPARPPRGLIISTGEDVPRGQSLRARVFVLDMGPKDLDWGALTECQGDALDGTYAKALAGFVQWLAPHYQQIRASLRKEVAGLQQWAVRGTTHRRTPQIVANLTIGLQYWLRYAQDSGAITSEEALAILRRCWLGLGEAAADQFHHQGSNEPTGRFLALLSSAIGSGRAHVAAQDGTEPDQPAMWGWREHTLGGPELSSEWRPSGECIGWLDGENLLVDPDASYAVVQRLARDQGDSLNVTVRTLAKRLKEKGFLASTDVSRQTLTVRRSLGRRRRDVLHFAAEVVSHATYAQPDQPDQTPLGNEVCPPLDVGTVFSMARHSGSQSHSGAQKAGELVGLVNSEAEDKEAFSRKGDNPALLEVGHEFERKSGSRAARLYPFIAQHVQTPEGPGSLLQAFNDRATVLLDSEKAKPTNQQRPVFFRPEDVQEA